MNIFSGNGNPLLSSQTQGREQVLNGLRSVQSASGNFTGQGLQLLQKLAPGEQFRAVVKDIQNTDVILQLSSGDEVHARMENAMSMNIGSEVTFQVKANNEIGLFIKPLQQDSVPMELILKSLMQAGIPQNEKNMSVVQALIQQGQPIRKENVMQTLKLVNCFPGESVDKLIEMQTNGIKINEESLKQFDRYRGGTQGISKDISRFTNAFTKYAESWKSEDLPMVSKWMEQLADIEKEINHLAGTSDVSEKGSSEQGSSEQGMKTPEGNRFLAGTDGKVEVPEGNVLKTGTERNVELPEGNVLRGMADGNIQKAVTGRMQVSQDSVLTTVAGQDAQAGEGMTGTTGSGPVYPAGNLAAGGMEQVFDLLDHAESFQDISNALKILAGIPDDTLRDALVRTKKIPQALQRILDKNTSLSLDELQDTSFSKSEIQKIYQRLFHLSESVLSSEQRGMASNQQLQQAASELKGNLQFMMDLNQFSSYIQIPYHFQDKRGQSELYVYGKKKQQYTKGEKVTAFLHFDLEALGATDIHVTLEQQSVSIRFVVEEDSSGELIMKHLHELEQRLEEQGYRASCKTEVVPPEQNHEKSAFEQLMANESSGTRIKRYVFDIRT